MRSVGSRFKFESCLHALRKPIFQGGEVSKSFLGNLLFIIGSRFFTLLVIMWGGGLLCPLRRRENWMEFYKTNISGTILASGRLPGPGWDIVSGVRVHSQTSAVIFPSDNIRALNSEEAPHLSPDPHDPRQQKLFVLTLAPINNTLLRQQPVCLARIRKLVKLDIFKLLPGILIK